MTPADLRDMADEINQETVDAATTDACVILLREAALELERLAAETANARTLKRLRLADKLATVTASYRKAVKTGEERAKRGIEVDKAIEEYRAAVEGK